MAITGLSVRSSRPGPATAPLGYGQPVEPVTRTKSVFRAAQPKIAVGQCSLSVTAIAGVVIAAGGFRCCLLVSERLGRPARLRRRHRQRCLRGAGHAGQAPGVTSGGATSPADSAWPAHCSSARAAPGSLKSPGFCCQWIISRDVSCRTMIVPSTLTRRTEPT
jgi:hypothetical protein